MEFGDRLKSAREAKGLSQERLGEGLGVSEPNASKQTVYGWEKNKHFPTSRQLALICTKLNQSADWLLFGRTPGEDMKSLNGLEAQLVLMYRGAPETAQDDILQYVNRKFSESTPLRIANPYPKAPKTTAPTRPVGTQGDKK